MVFFSTGVFAGFDLGFLALENEFGFGFGGGGCPHGNKGEFLIHWVEGFEG